MFLFSLAPALDAALAFIAGGAAGIALMRVAQMHPAAGTLTLVGDERHVAFTAAPSMDDLVDDSVLWSSGPTAETTAPATPLRTGRLPLPACVTALTPSDEPALAPVNAFADRLRALSLDDWLDVGRSDTADPTRIPQRAIAFALLEAAIAAHGLGIAAWYARDTIETAVCMATNRTPCATARERRLVAAAHGAAETAALALLARDVLAPTDFATLYAPFEHVVSREEIARLCLSRNS